MRLYFWPQGFPRDITRDEWRSIWRWKRITTKQLEDQEQSNLALLRDSKVPDYIKRDIVDQCVFPPLVAHEKQRMSIES